MHEAGDHPLERDADVQRELAADRELQNRTAMSVGAGMKRRSPMPAISSSCHSSSSPIGEIR